MRARIIAMWHAAGRHRTATFLAVVSLLALVWNSLFQLQFDAYVTTPLSRALAYLATQRAGYLGAALFVQLAVLMLLTFADTSPVVTWLRERGKARPKSRSLEDRQEVERIREFWSHEVREAMTAAVDVLAASSRRLVNAGNVLANLLHRPIDDLYGARRAFEEALPDESGTSFEEVRDALERLVVRYMTCAMWYNRCRHLDPTLLPLNAPEEQLREHRAWAMYHREFVPELQRLYRRTVYGGRGGANYPSELSLVKGPEDARLSADEIALDRWPETAREQAKSETSG